MKKVSSKNVWLKKIHGEMSHSKNIHVEKSYGSGSDIETFIGKTDVRKLESNNLMAKNIVNYI